MKFKLRLTITQKLTLLLVGLAVALLAAVVGVLAVYNGSLALHSAAVSELLATAIEKQAALEVWIGERQADLAALAATRTSSTIWRLAPRWRPRSSRPHATIWWLTCKAGPARTRRF